MKVERNIWFADESHFHLTGFCNKQTMKIWVTEKPNEVIKKGPFPILNRSVCYFRARNYWAIFLRKLWRNSGNRETNKLSTYDWKLFCSKAKRTWSEVILKVKFSCKTVPAHTAKTTLELLKKYFGTRILSYKSENVWPP
jgi:hypothetical protein